MAAPRFRSGRQRAALIYSMTVRVKINDADRQVRPADVQACITGYPVKRLDDLLPWHWATSSASTTDREAWP